MWMSFCLHVSSFRHRLNHHLSVWWTGIYKSHHKFLPFILSYYILTMEHLIDFIDVIGGKSCNMRFYCTSWKRTSLLPAVFVFLPLHQSSFFKTPLVKNLRLDKIMSTCHQLDSYNRSPFVSCKYGDTCYVIVQETKHKPTHRKSFIIPKGK